MGLKKSKLLLILGALSLAIGIALLTIFAPPSKITSTTELNQNSPVAYVSSNLYNVGSGGVEVEIDGPGKVFIGQAPDEDLKSWVGNAAHTAITGLDKNNNTVQAFTDGEKTVPNPSGNDLWISQNEGDKHVVTTWKNPENAKWGFLVASDGTSPVPKTLTMTWTNNSKNMFAWPLIGLGLLLGAASVFFKDRESDPLARQLKKDSKTKAKKPTAQETKPTTSAFNTQTSAGQQTSHHDVVNQQNVSVQYDDLDLQNPDLYLDEDEFDDTPLPSRRELREKERGE